MHLHQTDHSHNFNPIMPQLCQHTDLTYYAINYTGIICQGLAFVEDPHAVQLCTIDCRLLEMKQCTVLCIPFSKALYMPFSIVRGHAHE